MARFRVDNYFILRSISHQITSANLLTHWRATPDASDHAPERIVINQIIKADGKVKVGIDRPKVLISTFGHCNFATKLQLLRYTR